MVRGFVLLSGRLLLALAVLAFVGLGAAHRPHAADAAAAAFLQAGGSLAELCRSGGDADPGAECPACTLAQSLALAGTPPLPRLLGRLAGTVRPAPQPVAGPAQGPRAPPARGPPSALA